MRPREDAADVVGHSLCLSLFPFLGFHLRVCVCVPCTSCFTSIVSCLVCVMFSFVSPCLCSLLWFVPSFSLVLCLHPPLSAVCSTTSLVFTTLFFSGLFTLIPAIKRSLSSFLSASLHLGPILPAALSYSWHNVEENLPIAQVCSILIKTAGTNWMQSEEHICYNFQCYHSTSWDNHSRCNVFNKITFCICVSSFLWSVIPGEAEFWAFMKWNRRKEWHRTGKQVNLGNQQLAPLKWFPLMRDGLLISACPSVHKGGRLLSCGVHAWNNTTSRRCYHNNSK